MGVLNEVLLQLASDRVWDQARYDRGLQKQAVVPPEGSAGAMPGAPPAGSAGATPGAPPAVAVTTDPAAAAMAGALPAGGMAGAMGGMPMDPTMMGGAGGMPMDPTMMGGAGGMPGMPGGMPGMPGQKMKPEQYMQMLDFRLYNMQQQITAIMNAMDLKMPPGALVTPPGAAMAPPAEAAMPGGPQDPTTQQGPQPTTGDGGGSAIKPIEPLQGASPALAAGDGAKMAAQRILAKVAEAQTGEAATVSPVGTPVAKEYPPTTRAAAVAAMLRSRTQANQ